MTLLGLYPLPVMRARRADVIRGRMAAGDTLPEARAFFARHWPGAAALLAFNRE
jgi:hypothetical protein